MIKKLSFFIAVTWIVVGHTQVNNTSPYSYFGIGDENQQTTVASSSMGGINAALYAANELNFSNPAALSTLQFTTLSVAGKSKFLHINDGNESQSASYTSLSSLALGIPLGKKGGLMVGLQPATNVGYNINEEIFDTEDELMETNSFSGNGGANRFYGSFGYTIIKGLSLGIEGEYLFGNINNDILNQRRDIAFNTKHELISNLSGTSLKLGTQYHKRLKNDLNLSLGVSLKLKNTIKATSEEYMYSSTRINGIEFHKDTVVSNQNLKGEITRPTTITTGIGIGKANKWLIGFDYESQKALDFDESIFHNNNKIKYTPKSKYSIGGFWIPKTNSITSYWHRVVYRAGLKYEKTGLSVKGTGDFTAINDFGISFGLGFPIGNQLSQVNLGLEYGNRGSITDGLIKENYFNLRLGLNLTDKWFRKRKIN